MEKDSLFSVDRTFDRIISMGWILLRQRHLPVNWNYWLKNIAQNIEPEPAVFIILYEVGCWLLEKKVSVVYHVDFHVPWSRCIYFFKFFFLIGFDLDVQFTSYSVSYKHYFLSNWIAWGCVLISARLFANDHDNVVWWTRIAKHWPIHLYLWGIWSPCRYPTFTASILFRGDSPCIFQSASALFVCLYNGKRWTILKKVIKRFWASHVFINRLEHLSRLKHYLHRNEASKYRWHVSLG